jgi:hypothetical protein
MSLIPIEVVDFILEYNNIKLVFNKKTKSFHVTFLSYDPYNNVKELYQSIKLYGNSTFKYMPGPKYSIKWYEISCKNKWTIRDSVKLRKDADKVEEYTGYSYNNGKNQYFKTQNT